MAIFRFLDGGIDPCDVFNRKEDEREIFKASEVCAVVVVDGVDRIDGDRDNVQDDNNDQKKLKDLHRHSTAFRRIECDEKSSSKRHGSLRLKSDLPPVFSIS